MSRRRPMLAALLASLALLAGCGGGKTRLSIGVNRVGLDLAFKDPKLKDVDPRTHLPPAPSLAQLGITTVGDLLRVLEGEVTNQNGALQKRFPAPKVCPEALPDDVPARSAGSTILVQPALGTYTYHNKGTFQLSIGALATKPLPYPLRGFVELRDIRPFTPGSPTATDQANAQTGAGIPAVTTPDTKAVTGALPPRAPLTGTDLTADALQAEDDPFAKPFTVTAVQLSALSNVETTYAVSRVSSAGNAAEIARDRPGVAVQRLAVVPSKNSRPVELHPLPLPRLYALPLSQTSGPREDVRDNTKVSDSYTAPTPATGQEGIDSRNSVDVPKQVPRSGGVDAGETSPSKEAGQAATDQQDAAAKGTPAEGATVDPYDSRERDVASDRSSVYAIQRKTIDKERVDVCGTVIDTWMVSTIQTINFQDPEDPSTTYTERSTNLFNIAPQLGGLIVRQRSITSVTYTVQAAGAPIPVQLDTTYTTTLDATDPAKPRGA
jgi:hypothetical protein